MFGNGGDSSQPQDTGSMWGDMLGMGSLFKVITDPALMQHTHTMIAAVIEGANANRRIEAKLDRMLKALGQNLDDINDRWPDQFKTPALLEGNRANGAGSPALASGAVDDGSGGAPDGARTPDGLVRGGLEPDQTGGAK